MAIDPGEIFGRFLQNLSERQHRRLVYSQRRPKQPRSHGDRPVTAAVCLGTVAAHTQVPDVDR